MTSMIVTFKIMPESPDIDLARVEEQTGQIIKEFVGDTEKKTSIEPIAFGLKALNYIFVMDEKDSVDVIESKVSEIEGVNSVEVTDLRRAIG